MIQEVEIECEDIPVGFNEMIMSKERKERKKSLLKKRLRDMKRKNTLEIIEEEEKNIADKEECAESAGMEECADRDECASSVRMEKCANKGANNRSRSVDKTRCPERDVSADRSGYADRKVGADRSGCAYRWEC